MRFATNLLLIVCHLSFFLFFCIGGGFLVLGGGVGLFGVWVGVSFSIYCTRLRRVLFFPFFCATCNFSFSPSRCFRFTPTPVDTLYVFPRDFFTFPPFEGIPKSSLLTTAELSAVLLNRVLSTPLFTRCVVIPYTAPFEGPCTSSPLKSPTYPSVQYSLSFV